MRPLLFALLLPTVALLAQEAKPPSSEAASARPENEVAMPTGSIELGYRVIPSLSGSLLTYRSIVNLGEGPRLLGAEIAFPGGKCYNTFSIRMNSWGGDPYNSLRLLAEKQGLYRLTFAYRNTAYFNALPSFANPLGTFNQRSFDQRQRFFDADLDLGPGKRFTPFVGVSRQAARGSAVSPIVFDANTYAAATQVNYAYTTGRVGVRLTLDRFHVTFEHAEAKFHDDQALNIDARNTGNRSGSYLGQILFVGKASDSYAIEGRNSTTGVHLTAAAASWLDLSGQIYYTRPDTNARLSENATGLFILLDQLRFVSGIQSFTQNELAQPRTSANAAAEFRPFKHVRIVESISTDKLNNTTAIPITWNYNEQRIEGFVDVNSWFTLRAGHKYTWGESFMPRGQLDQAQGSERAQLRRQAFLGGVVLRPLKSLTINADAEIASGDKAWFRTTLTDFNSLRLRARYQLNAKWMAAGNFVRVHGSNPSWAGDYAYANTAGGASLHFTPSARWSALAEYTRGALYSDIQFRDPSTFGALRSLYRDNSHSATFLLDANLHARMKLTAGGTMLKTTGTRPTSFYQPQGRVTIPIRKTCELFGEWRYYGFGELFYAPEAFRTHQITAGIRLMTAPKK